MCKPIHTDQQEHLPEPEGSSDSRLLSIARAAADKLMVDHPVFPSYLDHISVLVVGSLGAGYADDRSDIDLWFVCSEDASADMAQQLRENSLRFDEPPPHTLTLDGTEVHYFALSIGRLRSAIEAHDDTSLYIAKHCVVCHDAGGQFRALAESVADLPANVIRDKVADVYAWVRVYVKSVAGLLQRYQPSAWLQCVSDLAYRVPCLCCWLDGQAPASPKWVMRQAESCSTAYILIPALREVLRTMGAILGCERVQADTAQPLLSALEALDSAARQALDASGYADVPTPALTRAQW